jgi:hypothetical protein
MQRNDLWNIELWEKIEAYNNKKDERQTEESTLNLQKMLEEAIKPLFKKELEIISSVINKIETMNKQSLNQNEKSKQEIVRVEKMIEYMRTILTQLMDDNHYGRGAYHKLTGLKVKAYAEMHSPEYKKIEEQIRQQVLLSHEMKTELENLRKQFESKFHLKSDDCLAHIDQLKHLTPTEKARLKMAVLHLSSWQNEIDKMMPQAGNLQQNLKKLQNMLTDIAVDYRTIDSINPKPIEKVSTHSIYAKITPETSQRFTENLKQPNAAARPASLGGNKSGR